MLEYFNHESFIQTTIIVGSISLFSVGLFGVLTQKHIIKLFMSIEIMELSAFLFFIGLASKTDRFAPILYDKEIGFANMNDPVIQAMILTAIVIGMTILALGVSFAIEYYKLTKIDSIDKMRELKF